MGNCLQIFSLSSDAKSEILLTLYHQNEEVFRTSQFVQLAQKMATERTKDVTQHIDLLTDTPVKKRNYLIFQGQSDTRTGDGKHCPCDSKDKKRYCCPTFVLNQSETDEVVHSVYIRTDNPIAKFECPFRSRRD
jgi:hypothetical protein